MMSDFVAIKEELKVADQEKVVAILSLSRPVVWLCRLMEGVVT
jgi:hypothetical protein